MSATKRITGGKFPPLIRRLRSDSKQTGPASSGFLAQVDEVHMTRSDKTFEVVVFGPGMGGRSSG